MGFRDYNPGLNRFLTRDNYNGALSGLNLGADPFTGNRYAFTGGNPISRIEIDGHCWAYEWICETAAAVDAFGDSAKELADETWTAATECVGNLLACGGGMLDAGAAIIDDPMGVAGQVWDSMTQSVEDELAQGNIGRAIGRSLFAGVAALAPGGLIGKLSKIGTPSPWELDPFQRGVVIEQQLGHNLPGNFPTIDKFENGKATSIKSLDTTGATYQNVKTLERTLTGYIDKVKGFNGANWAGVNIQAGDIRMRELQLAVPGGKVSPAQQVMINNMIAYGQRNNVLVSVVEIK
jgi:hypothetical protein